MSLRRPNDVASAIRSTEVTMNAAETISSMPYGWLMRHWERASSDEWAQVLATFSLFSGIRRRRLRKLIRHATFAEFAPGDDVVVRDAPTDSLYLILGGTAKARGKPAALRFAQHEPAIWFTMLSDLGVQFRRLETQASQR
jgi:hypothetical protein